LIAIELGLPVINSRVVEPGLSVTSRVGGDDAWPSKMLRGDNIDPIASGATRTPERSEAFSEMVTKK
jgi:hypothetical protein